MPKFNIEREGYNKQEVDGYIEKLRVEYVKLGEVCKQYRELIEKEGYSKQEVDGYIEKLRVEYVKLGEVCKQYRERIRALEETAGTQEKRRNRTRPADIMFYAVLLIGLAVLFAFYGGGDGAPRSLLGYSAMRVLTASMQSEIPKDSLIVTKEVGSETLELGDDITFLQDADTTVTHRIVGIQENFAGTGARGFQTQGVMNSSPDQDIVAAQNVVGKVVFHNLLLGRAVGFIRENVLWIGIFTALFIALFTALRVALSKDDPETVTQT